MHREKRKHIRIEHRGSVEFAAGERKYRGTSINISRSGMQVMVNMPESHDSIRSIAFSLPSSAETVHMPCRTVRVTRSGKTKEQVLGIEFLYQAEAQMLLVEKFVQDMKQNLVNAAAQLGEKRQLPRTACYLRDVEIDRPDARVLSIDNISGDGLLITFQGPLTPGETVALSFFLPGDTRKLRARGTVVFVIENVFRRSMTAGVRLQKVKEIDEARIRNFIVACSSGNILKGLFERFKTRELNPEYRITDANGIAEILKTLSARNIYLNALIEGSFKILELRIADLRQDRGDFWSSEDKEFQSCHISRGLAAYFAFPYNGCSHYFKTEVTGFSGNQAAFQLPQVIFRSEKRSYQRKSMDFDTKVLLFIDRGKPLETVFQGMLVDISRRGFLCEMPIPSSDRHPFRKGQTIRYKLEDRLGLDNHGQVRHIKRLPSMAGGAVLRIGIEAGIERYKVRQSRIDFAEWERQELSVTGTPDRSIERTESMPVRFRNRKNQEICALINATRTPVRAPVVIIPPAYGKKKEALAPLVTTLLSNFRKVDKDIVTVRFDGINRPGESYNDARNPRRGYEMLHYRISQGLDDLQATLDFAYNNPYFTPEKLILITFSMSAIDARKVLLSEMEKRVDFWISCMGVPSAQLTVRNILGGIDIIANYKMGIPNGIMGMLGHLINMDIMAQDLIEKKYAFMTDARIDMSKISIPVLWIYGTYDKWVAVDEILDLMSVKSMGSREVVEIPAGHNLRSSDDAIKTFKLMTARIHEKLYGERMAPSDPCKEEMLRLITLERERLVNREVPAIEDYWRGYLIGNERNSAGYDFYKNIEEFRDFLRFEVELLELKEAEKVADMGCGTGLLLEVLLENIASRGEKPDFMEISAVDLVPEALDKTRAKCERLLEANPRLSQVNIKYIKTNLEPNRLIPVRMFLDRKEPDFNSLRNKIEGLKNSTIDLLMDHESSELYAFMRGSLPARKTLEQLEKRFGGDDLQAVVEFNRAARFLRGRLNSADLKPDRRTDPGRSQDCLRTGNLNFEVLNFGDNGLDLSLGFAEGAFTKIIASLFISYLFNPEYILAEFFRMLKPGGKLLVSSMKPDSDISLIFTNYIQRIQNQDSSGDSGLRGALAMLNEAAGLFELEEDGFFRFYADDELTVLFEQSGFANINVRHSMGNPAQAHIVIGEKPIGIDAAGSYLYNSSPHLAGSDRTGIDGL